MRQEEIDGLPCPWLVVVPSRNPEPDSPADMWTEVECGSPLHAYGPEGERCENGHEFGNLERRWAPFGPEWELEAQERFAETGRI